MKRTLWSAVSVCCVVLVVSASGGVAWLAAEGAVVAFVGRVGADPLGDAAGRTSCPSRRISTTSSDTSSRSDSVTIPWSDSAWRATSGVSPCA